MRPSRVALVGGAAALAGAGAISLAGRQEAPPPSATLPALWSCPTVPAGGCARSGGQVAWWSRKGTAILQGGGAGLASASADPGTPVAVRHYAFTVPLNDPLLLGEAPVTVTLAYALTDRHGWADARLDVQPYALEPRRDKAGRPLEIIPVRPQPGGERRHTAIIGARDGGDALRIDLSPDMVRAEGRVRLNLTLRVRALNGGAARLVLRSITLAGGLG